MISIFDIQSQDVRSLTKDEKNGLINAGVGRALEARRLSEASSNVGGMTAAEHDSYYDLTPYDAPIYA